MNDKADLNYKELAKLLDIKVSYLYNLVSANKVPYIKHDNGRVKFPEQAIKTWMEKGEVVLGGKKFIKPPRLNQNPKSKWGATTQPEPENKEMPKATSLTDRETVLERYSKARSVTLLVGSGSASTTSLINALVRADDMARLLAAGNGEDSRDRTKPKAPAADVEPVKEPPKKPEVPAASTAIMDKVIEMAALKVAEAILQREGL